MGQIANELLALNSAKHAIRQAINDKGGGPLSKAAPLSAYPAALDAMPPADAAWSDEWCRVVFVDVGGVVLKDTWVRRYGTVIPPTVPEHEKLTFKEWNWGPDKLAAVPHDMVVGPVYEVAENATWIKAKINAGTVVTLQSTRFGGTIMVDWGDGTTNTYTLSASGSASNSHTYNDSFDGWIKMTLVERTGTGSLQIGGSSNKKMTIDAALGGAFGVTLGGSYLSVSAGDNVYIWGCVVNTAYALPVASWFKDAVVNMSFPSDGIKFFSGGDPDGDYHREVAPNPYYSAWKNTEILDLDAARELQGTSSQCFAIFPISIVLRGGLTITDTSSPWYVFADRVFFLSDNWTSSTNFAFSPIALILKDNFTPPGHISLSIARLKNIVSVADKFAITETTKHVILFQAKAREENSEVAQAIETWTEKGYTVTIRN